jgi:hypothetical protein
MTSSTEPEPGVVSQRASVEDNKALEALITSLPPSVAALARTLTKSPGSRRMHFAEPLESVYVLWHRRVDHVFTCTTFRNIKSMDQAAELWDEIEKLSLPDTGIMRRLYAKITGVAMEPEPD